VLLARWITPVTDLDSKLFVFPTENIEGGDSSGGSECAAWDVIVIYTSNMMAAVNSLKIAALFIIESWLTLGELSAAPDPARIVGMARQVAKIYAR